MSIDQADRIDFISLSEDGNEVELTITDHVEWEHAEEHLRMIQVKVGLYVDVIENGEIFERYPKAAGRQFVIRVRGLHQPPPRVLPQLEDLAAQTKALGIPLEFEYPRD